MTYAPKSHMHSALCSLSLSLSPSLPPSLPPSLSLSFSSRRWIPANSCSKRPLPRFSGRTAVSAKSENPLFFLGHVSFRCLPSQKSRRSQFPLLPLAILPSSPASANSDRRVWSAGHDVRDFKRVDGSPAQSFGSSKFQAGEGDGRSGQLALVLGGGGVGGGGWGGGFGGFERYWARVSGVKLAHELLCGVI